MQFLCKLCSKRWPILQNSVETSKPRCARTGVLETVLVGHPKSTFARKGRGGTQESVRNRIRGKGGSSKKRTDAHIIFKM